ncbi:hypothetical protein CBR_g8684 [Chara braunii]|uniref:F-box domain-containing protein n=1 Tax=Chara braunii TaxID=69332 RepID=A0A388KMU6_CHABU|nr:hypothetical protein CBR_g8684 [Chara braunii]|eukprot:GBG71263.1 hypothetical protein CBR_g8684 [Chara braunii]
MESTIGIEKERNTEDVSLRREGDPTRDQQTDQRPDYLPALPPERGEMFFKNDAAKSESAGVERETEGVFLESDAERDVANAEEKGGAFLSERSDTETSPQHSDDSSHRPSTSHDHHPPYTCHDQCDLKDKRADDVGVGHDSRDLCLLQSDTETPPQHRDDSTHRPCTDHHQHHQWHVEDKHANEVGVGHDLRDLDLSERDTETPPPHRGDASPRPCTDHHQHPPHTRHQECNLEDKRADDVAVGHDWRELEHDALVHIFSFLSFVQQKIHVGAVCKSWHRASLDPCCWKEADAFVPSFWRSDSTKRAATAAVMRSQGQLIRLATWDCDPDILDLIGRNCPLLQQLELMSFGLDRPWIEAVDAIGNGCQGLRELIMTMTFAPPEDKSPDFTRKLLPSLPKLTALHLGDTLIDDGVISVMGDNLPNLEILTLAVETEITDASLGFIGQKFRGLKTLVLKYCGKVTGAGLNSLWLARPKLQVVVE